MTETSRTDGWTGGIRFEELRRKNPTALAMDGLYLSIVAFFTFLAMQGFWPAAIAAIPLLALFALGYRSSPAFLLVELGTAVATVGVMTILG
ncbi:MAG: hypothetical protein ABEJ67_05825 [Halanaeroarchaeum sp.]